MQNIKITHVFQGLEPLVQAIDNLAEAIRNQEAFVVPTDSASEQASAAAPESAAAQEPVKKPAKKSTAKSSKKEVTLDDVRAKFRELAQKGHKNELKTLLAEYDVENVSALDESVFAEVLERLGEIG